MEQKDDEPWGGVGKGQGQRTRAGKVGNKGMRSGDEARAWRCRDRVVN